MSEDDFLRDESLKNRKKDRVPLDAARARFGKAKGRIVDAL